LHRAILDLSLPPIDAAVADETTKKRLRALHRLLDGARDDIDPDVQRRWLISRICQEFSCLPSDAARELDEDPEHLALEIIDYRGYAAAKFAFDHTKDKVDGLKAWDGNRHMTLVEQHAYERHQESLTPPAAESGDGR
jgi:hypothetical protein